MNCRLVELEQARVQVNTWLQLPDNPDWPQLLGTTSMLSILENREPNLYAQSVWCQKQA